MFVNNPIILIISFLCSFTHAIILKGKKEIFFTLKFLLPVLIFTSLLNPLFNHAGISIITYLPSGNPLTVESVVFGVFSGILLCSVILWFNCFNEIFTSDKLVYLFGRISPPLSLVISMSLRFVPRFNKQFKEVCFAQKTLGNDISNGSIFRRIRVAVKILSIMITASLENSIETSFSMKSRGFGTAHRTSYSIFKFTKSDVCLFIFLLTFGLVEILLTVFNKNRFYYFPEISPVVPNFYTVIYYLIFLFICILPIVLDIKEDKKWKYLK